MITGQKVWTSLAHVADWCFVLARTAGRVASRTAGLSYLLVPMHQPGVTVRPIRQLTGTSEFNEVFFDDARTDGATWSSASRATAGGSRWARSRFERGVATLGQQVGFRRELGRRGRRWPGRTGAHRPTRSAARAAQPGPGSG